MEINLLVLDVGNSRLGIGVFVEGELKQVSRIAHTHRPQWRHKLTEAWDLIKDRENAAIAGVSVNPGILESLEHMVKEVTTRHVEWVGRDLDLPTKVLTETPAATGVDRVLNVAAAFEQMGKACVVVDAGTAVTVDLCNDQGEFLGGAIAPGATMMLRALNEKTAKLPLVELAAPSGPYGRDTQSAILQGVFHSIRGLVKEVVENYATELGTWPDIIATGGDAEILFGGWELIHAIAPDLSMYGIAHAYTEHYLKHEA